MKTEMIIPQAIRLVVSIRFTLTCSLVIFLLLISSVNVWAEKKLQFDLIGTVQTSYDDNITSVGSGKIDDVVTDVSLGLEAKREGRTNQLAITTTVTQQLFADNTDFDNTAQNVDLEFFQDISKRERLTITNEFSHAEEPRSFDDSFGRTPGRYNFVENEFNVLFDKEISKQWAFQARYGNEIYEVSRDVLSDSILHRAGFQLGWKHTTRMKYILDYEFLNRDFDPGDQVTVHKVATGFQKDLTNQLALEVRGGASFVENFDGKHSTDPNFLVALINDTSETTRLNLTFEQESDSDESTEDVFESWKVSGILEHLISERLGLELDVFYGEGEFSASDVDEEFLGANVTFEYDLTKDIKSFVSYSFLEVDSNDDSRDYTRNLSTLGMSLDF